MVPGGNYHLKIVIADRIDPVYDSALFIGGGSFNITGEAQNVDFTIPLDLPPYIVCDDNNDGMAQFNLASYNSNLTAEIANPESNVMGYRVKVVALQGKSNESFFG